MAARTQAPFGSTAPPSDLVEVRASTSGTGLGARNWLLFLILSAAAFAWYSFRWSQAPLPIADTPTYMEVVQGFLQGHFSQIYSRTPGLPLFLLIAGTGRTYFYTTLLLHLLSVAGLAFLLSRLNVQMFVIWAFVFIALLPPYVQNSAFLGTESITASFLALGFVALSLYILDRRWAFCWLAAICFLWAGLARPTNLVTPFVLAAILLALPKQNLSRAAALLILIPAILLGSYISFSAFRSQYFGMSAMAGYQLSNATVPLYEYIDNPIAREEFIKARNDLRARHLPANFAVWKARSILKQRLGLSDAQLGQFLLQMNLRLLLHHPEIYIEGIARSLNIYWFPFQTKFTSGNRVLKVFWYGLNILIEAAFLLELTILAGMFIGSYVLNKKFEFSGEGALLYWLAIAIVYQTMIVSYIVIGLGSPRYRSTTDLLILFAVAFITDWGRRMWLLSHRPLVLEQAPAPQIPA